MNKAPEVVCAGIIVADHVCTPIDHLPAAGELVLTDRLSLTTGGCAANVAVDLAKMGVKATVVGRVGDDIFGRIVVDMLGESGLDLSGIKATEERDTSQTLIVNVKGEDRRFIHTFGANGDFSAADLPRSMIQSCRVLYLGGYLLMEKLRAEDLIPIFAAARQAGTRIVLDVVTPGPADYWPRLEALLPQVDVFMPNELEGQLITGKSDPREQALAFHRQGVTTSIVTLGGGGAIVAEKGRCLKVESFHVPFVDGSGGGDAFAAGYIYGLLNNLSTENCMRYASALGASCVTKIGTTAGVFTRSECEAFLENHELPIEVI